MSGCRVRDTVERARKTYHILSVDDKDIVKARQAIAWNCIVNKATKCWEWQGPIAKNGYGSAQLNSKTYIAHRLSYAAFRGEIPAKLQVCHTCDVRHCVNPAHLWLGTIPDNQRDKALKERANQKLTAADVHEIRALRGSGLLQREIGALFGVSQEYISQVLSGVCRQHVTAPDASHLSACSLPEARSQRQSAQTYLFLPPSLRAFHDRLRSAAEAN